MRSSRDVSISQQKQLDAVQLDVGVVADGVGSLNEKSDKLSNDLEKVQLTTADTQRGMETLVAVQSSKLLSRPMFFFKVLI